MKIDVTNLMRPHVAAMQPYQPILPFEVLSSLLGRSPHDIVKLDANENPYGPSPRVRQALAMVDYPHIYPDPESRQLREALADFTGLPMEYLHSMWINNIGLSTGVVTLPSMNGHGGNFVVILPSGVIAIRFSDSNHYDISHMIAVAEFYRRSFSD